MEISAQMIWWVVAGALVAVELLTGTVYLLMIALGAAAGAACAQAQASLTMQICAAAIVAVVGTLAWHNKRKRMARLAPATNRNPDVHGDIGETLVLPADWLPGTNESRVAYRGSTWSAESADGSTLTPGRFRIAALKGNTLVLERVISG